ncbi:multicopper oxidase domain-containing protein [Sandaracinobacter neustonicus]|uniref:multicopper oxidase domain-containing protein n=1 Tax=Sandaracinobacter neustonicus TaxID=1715348 RepID=UPI001A9CADDE|nr:multicopper oxidase domain-containing protein [Sandaracinobacter neustonicus]
MPFPKSLQLLILAGALAVTTAETVLAAETTVDLVTRREKLEVNPGRRDTVVTLNGGVPGPVLRFREGDTVTVNLKNELPEMTAIHWHGLLIPGHHDGAPGFNGFPGIASGETYTYQFTLRQSGTYWYHSHASLQEQAGQYGALIIEPKDGPDIVVDREHVILLTEHTPEDPERIIRNLKADSGYYNWNKRTFPELLRDAGRFGLGKTLSDRAQWGRMRMDPTDIADVANYTLLVNGLPTARAPFFEMKAGEKVRLRFINGSAMSFMDVRMPGLSMKVVAADGRPVEPVTVDEFRMAVAETYDVIVEPKDDRAYPLWVETIDRRASLLATLGPNPGTRAEAPAPRPMQVLMMGEMGHAMPAMQMAESAMAPSDPDTDILNAAAKRQPAPAGGCSPEHAAMGHCSMPEAPPAAVPAASCSPEHAAMGHCTMPAAPQPAAPATSCSPEHAAMGHCKLPEAPVVPAIDPNCPPEHAAMGHCTPKVVKPEGGERVGTAVSLAAKPEGGTAFPRVDYGYGRDPMAGMDHSAMNHGAELGREGDTDGSGRVLGWATGAPYGARVLSMNDLVSAAPHTDARAPTRDIVIRITGNMERYIWTLNGKPFGEAPPVDVQFGERVRITFVNETMMAHPMHLHGMFFEIENGQPADRLPEKNVIAVAPGRTQSVLLTADEPGEWPLHCHLLFHMDSGMMKKLIVANVSAPPGQAGEVLPKTHTEHGSH